MYAAVGLGGSGDRSLQFMILLFDSAWTAKLSTLPRAVFKCRASISEKLVSLKIIENLITAPLLSRLCITLKLARFC
ncbi:MAG TPA: hypothetical protein DDW84_05410 [Phycisphaerales bacterium]|nr:hypothetical protein [Phycisphaerales bacterium]HBR18823.1 hypothetical protein [Phycisphaerales bacterium]